MSPPGKFPSVYFSHMSLPGIFRVIFCLCLLQMLKKGKIDLEIPLLKFQFPFLNFFYYTYYQITFSIIFFKVTPKGAKLCKVALGMLNDRGNSTTSPCLVWLIVKLICYTQTLRVFHLSYLKYVLQISFNSFQFISSKF